MTKLKATFKLTLKAADSAANHPSGMRNLDPSASPPCSSVQIRVKKTLFDLQIERIWNGAPETNPALTIPAPSIRVYPCKSVSKKTDYLQSERSWPAFFLAHLQDLPCSPISMYCNTPLPDSLRQILNLSQPTQFRFNV